MQNPFTSRPGQIGSVLQKTTHLPLTIAPTVRQHLSFPTSCSNILVAQCKLHTIVLNIHTRTYIRKSWVCARKCQASSKTKGNVIANQFAHSQRVLPVWVELLLLSLLLWPGLARRGNCRIAERVHKDYFLPLPYVPYANYGAIPSTLSTLRLEFGFCKKSRDKEAIL